MISLLIYQELVCSFLKASGGFLALCFPLDAIVSSLFHRGVLHACMFSVKRFGFTCGNLADRFYCYFKEGVLNLFSVLTC